MPQPIIKVDHLSKKFMIQHEAGAGGRYTSLRDVISDRVRGIGKKKEQTRAKEEEFWALHDVSFEVEQGDRVGIIGRNGAGKSTLLKVLSQITEPSSGSIRIKGRVASLLEVGTGFHPELTGRENIFLNGAILGMSRAEIKRKFDEIVAFAETEKFLDTPVKRYSSGMYVRLAFAVAAHLEPEILIIDEVLAVGDAQFQMKCLGKMEDVSNNEGRTVLFVSHNMGAIKHLCTKGMLLKDGRISVNGNIQEVVNEYSKSPLKNESKGYRHIAGNQAVKIDKLVIANIDEGIGIYDSIHISINHSEGSSSDNLHLDGFHFFLLIHNSEGEVVWSIFQKDSDTRCGNVQGVIKVEIVNILTPGQYLISAGIFDKSNQFLDWVENAETFEVLPVFKTGVSFDQRFGKVTTEGEWSV
jgi:lipopolysaccharide transport system ATP-binding protein